MDSNYLFREIVGYDRSLRESLRNQPASSREAIQHRAILLEKSEILAASDAKFAAEKELEQLLWKPCFYKRIEDFRRRIRKYASASATDRTLREHFFHVSKGFQSFLDESMAFYYRLRTYFGQFVVDYNEQTANDASHLKCRQSVHRCLVFLGDLARYKELHSQKAKKNFTIAENYYHQALNILPDNGNPHNQLAVLATYSEAETIAVYRYCRSLMVSQPFVTSEENLVLLFERSRQRPIAARGLAITAKSSPKEKSAYLKSFLHRLSRLHGMLFSMKNSFSQSSSQSGMYDAEMQELVCADLSVLLESGVIGDALFLKILIINIFFILSPTFNTATPVETIQKKGKLELVQQYSLSLTLKMLQIVMEYVLQMEITIVDKNHCRLLGAVHIFTDFVVSNSEFLAEIMTKLTNDDVLAEFGATLAQLLNACQLAIVNCTALLPLNSVEFQEKSLFLKEFIELKGFQPISNGLKFYNTTKKYHLNEQDAVVIQCQKLLHFGHLVVSNMDIPIPLYYSNNEYSATDIVPDNRMENDNSQSSMTPPPLSGLHYENDAEEEEEEEDDFDDEVIVFQPAFSTIKVPTSDFNDNTTRLFLISNNNNNSIAKNITKGCSTFETPFGGETFKGSANGSLLNFNDFTSNEQNYSSFNTWGNNTTNYTTSNTSPSNSKRTMPTTTLLSKPFMLDSNTTKTHTYENSLFALEAIEQVSANYENQESSLSMFFRNASPQKPLVTRQVTPPPPGFRTIDDEFSIHENQNAPPPPRANYFTRNPFIIENS